jgi:hypothetical protein
MSARRRLSETPLNSRLRCKQSRRGAQVLARGQKKAALSARLFCRKL